MTMPAFTSAALAGVPAGVQAQGVWMGHRQMFVKFAGEAETATMYSADALARDLQRQSQRGTFHSVSVTGRDPLANADFLIAALSKAALAIPVMLDIDGQRPRESALLAPHVTLYQITLDPGTAHTTFERAAETLGVVAQAERDAAFVLVPTTETTDAQIVRCVEEVHRVNNRTDVIILPPTSGEPTLDRRWAALLEQAVQLHPRTRLGARIPGPTGMR